MQSHTMHMPEHHETIIIGAGPAGLQMAYYMQKANNDYLVLEKSSVAGSTFINYPRHRTLISINKRYTGEPESEYEKNMRWDWNSLLTTIEDTKIMKRFTDYTGEYFPNADVLCDYLRDYARTFNLKIAYNNQVRNIRKKGDIFTMETGNGKKYTCKTLVCCTGFRLPYLPAIPGIELVEHYPDMPVDPSDFKNQEVLVVGKGNSGFETADNLIATTALVHVASPNPLNFAWKTHYVGHLRAVNNNFLDTYQLKSQNAVLDATLTGIKRTADGKYAVDLEYSHAQGEKETLTYDRVLNCTGFRFDDSLFHESCKPTLSHCDKFPKQTSSWESTNVPNLFFAGVLQHERDYRKHTSGFIHGFRYTVRTLFHIINERIHKVPYPSVPVTDTVDGLVKCVVDRVNSTSALWQQFGFLMDVIAIKDGKAKFHPELTLDYIKDSKFAQLDRFYTVSLEFNKVCGDPFAIQRAPVPDKAQDSIFLHPVVRHFSKGALIDEIHILEDLYTNWTHPTQHIAPLRKFFTQSLSGVKKMRSRM